MSTNFSSEDKITGRKRVLVSGGAGFIGSAMCRYLINDALDRLNPDGAPHDRHIAYVTDRPGHDHRNAIDATKLEREVGWKAQETFATGLSKTSNGISIMNGGGLPCAIESTAARGSVLSK
jgi:dTDP-D-glucose 4,6-dehydratase